MDKADNCFAINQGNLNVLLTLSQHGDNILPRGVIFWYTKASQIIYEIFHSDFHYVINSLISCLSNRINLATNSKH